MYSKFKFIFFLIVLITNNSYAQSEQDISKDLYNISNIYNTIKDYYVEDVDKNKAFKSSIKGMVESLDNHSQYLNPEELSNFHTNTDGEFGGIGIFINIKDDFIEIISPIDNTPGYRKGLRKGDLIIEIEGQSTNGMNLTDAVKLMRGEVGTEVEITIFRKNTSPFKLKIKREIITVESVKGYLLEKDIAYIRISTFQAKSYKLLIKIIKELKEKNKGNLKGIILDLRDNPGGLMYGAIKIADIFIDGNDVIVETKGKTKKMDETYYATPGNITNAKMITLINKGSASASEIVAGALQDLNRSVIMGSQSYGKGSVQSILNLKNGYALKLTMAYFYTSSGKIIQGNGITPNIIFTETDVDLTTKEDISTNEDDLEQKDSEMKLNTNGLNEKEIISIQKNLKKQENKEIIKLLNEQEIIKKAIQYLKDI